MPPVHNHAAHLQTIIGTRDNCSGSRVRVCALTRADRQTCETHVRIDRRQLLDHIRRQKRRDDEQQGLSLARQSPESSPHAGREPGALQTIVSPTGAVLVNGWTPLGSCSWRCVGAQAQRISGGFVNIAGWCAVWMIVVTQEADGAPRRMNWLSAPLLCVLPPARTAVVARQCHDKSACSTSALTKEHPVHSRTRFLLSFSIPLPSVEAKGRWLERGRMGRP
jgi:hypothetical protein